MDTTFGQKFREIRKQKKISQEELATKSRVSRSTIIRLEKGGDIKKENLDRLLDVIGCRLSIDDNVIGDGDMMNTDVKYVEFDGIRFRIEKMKGYGC